MPQAKERFIRGVDADNALESTQEDAGKNVTGDFGHWGLGNFGILRDSADAVGAFKQGRRTSGVLQGGGGLSYNVAFDASRIWGTEHTADEFRPDNVALLYCQKD